MSRKGFTLIELLVVIAIIAILAAILFPVFAQAKDSAKNTTLLNGVKQMGTAATMHATDYDDLFPVSMASHPTQPVDNAWQDLIQPYQKNYDLVYNLKRPRPDTTGPNATWLRLQHFGMTARAVTSTNATARTQGYYSGTHAGRAVIYDGVAGFANLDPSQPDWLGRTAAPSLSTSEIEDVSGTALIVEGNNWDLWWSLVGSSPDPLRTCAKWNPDDANITGGRWAYAGPTTSTRPNNGHTGYDGTTTGCNIPEGRSTYVATDTSARSVDFRANMYGGTLGKDGVTYVVKAFNPSGR